jgi:hypothetical protein
MVCDAGRGIPGVPHLGQDSWERNSPQLAHHSSSAPHCEQYESPGPSGPPHWKQVMVVVMPLPGETPWGKDNLYCLVERLSAIYASYGCLAASLPAGGLPSAARIGFKFSPIPIFFPGFRFRKAHHLRPARATMPLGLTQPRSVKGYRRP